MDEDKKNRILQAALLVFAQKGFEKATVAEIAVAAGVGKGTVYEYFKSKQEIMEVASLEHFSEIVKMLGELAKIENNWQALVTLVEQTISFWNEMYDLIPVAFDFWAISLKEPESFVGKKIKAGIDGMINTVTEIIEKGQKSGQFKNNVNAKYVSLLLFTMLDEGMLFNLWLEGSFDQDEYRDSCLAMVGNYLLYDPTILDIKRS